MTNFSFKPLSNPILLIGDAPECLTGLARIGRDLASLLCQMPEFRVAYLGRGGIGRRKFPWMQYGYPEHSLGQWGEDYLATVWNDFAGNDNGIVMSTWDASRMLWFARPEQMRLNAPITKFLGPSRNFSKWGYFAIDSTGPDAKTLSVGATSTISGYDRVLAASRFGEDVMIASGIRDTDWLPHGIWANVFKPCERKSDEYIIVGCNMANQTRKDFPAAFECAAVLKQEYGNRFKFWLHTDELIRHWNVYALAADYGVADCLEVTTDLTDAELAERYSQCACTILPSAGEGFGYPIAESLACGTGCVVTDYAAGAELVPEDCRVRPLAYRVDTIHNSRRAVLSGYAFAVNAKAHIEGKLEDWEYKSQEIACLIDHLDWNKLKGVWERWLRNGLSQTS